MSRGPATGAPLPNFLVIGAQRCGTTWIDRVLRLHPQIYLPDRRKEVHYFDDHYQRGSVWYQEFFADVANAQAVRAIGEVTPRYLYSPMAPIRIAQDYPRMRLVAILRQPADRAYSQFGMHAARKGASRSDFVSFLDRNPDSIYRGLYYVQLERYFKLFPPDQVLILIFEEAMARPLEALESVCQFLGIKNMDWPIVELQRRTGASIQPRFARARAAGTRIARFLRDRDLDRIVNHAKAIGAGRLFGNRGELPSLDPKLRAELTRLFEPDIERLEAFLGRELMVWRNSTADPR